VIVSKLIGGPRRWLEIVLTPLHDLGARIGGKTVASKEHVELYRV